MIFIIDDDPVMTECIKRVIVHKSSEKVKTFSNAIAAIQTIDEVEKISLIFLDIMLDGPNGFTFLNELMSYQDTAHIPVVLVTALRIKEDLLDYGVVGVLNKLTMRPKEIERYVVRYAR